MDLAEYSLQMDPAQRQVLMAEVLRQRQRGEQQDQLAGSFRNSRRLDNTAVISQMSRNPELAAAAKLAQQSATAGAPKQLGTQGFVLPESGEFVPSPIYEDERRATRDQQRSLLDSRLDAQRDGQQSREEVAREGLTLRRTIAEQVSADRREGMLLRQTLAGMAAGSRAERNADKAAADAEKRAEKAAADADKATTAGVQKLSAFADKKQIPRLISNARQLAEQLANSEDDDKIPGFSTTEQISGRLPGGDRLLRKEALDNMSAIQGIYNAFTRADAGLSQTLGETQRQALEMFNSPTTSAKGRAQIFREHIIPLIESSRTATLGSANQSVRDAYRQYQMEVGGDPGWMDPISAKKKPKGATAPTPAKPATPSDDDLIKKYLK
jgi:hypothetical protein